MILAKKSLTKALQRNMFDNMRNTGLSHTAIGVLPVHLVIRLFVIALLLAGTACSVDEGRRRSRQQLPDYGGREAELSRAPLRKRMSWEVWPLQRDLHGVSLTDINLMTGDELLLTGKRQEALLAYEKARLTATTPDGKEATALRIASTQLALRQATRSLATVSEYFRLMGKSVDGVDGHFSLLLGYGYAATSDIDQALAWFARAHRVAKGRGPINDSAVRGIGLILKVIPGPAFEGIAQSWAGDRFVAGLIAQERRRRNLGGEPGSLGIGNSAIYESEGVVEESSTLHSGDSTTVAAGQSVIGVLLPLSGKFATLGANVKNGIELAVSAEGSQQIRAIFKDDAGDAAVASARARELISADQSTVVLGPLLSELGEVTAGVATELGRPVLTYSKKESFAVGRGVFRLGATSGSQVQSLLDATEQKLGLRRYAIVYPEDANGTEFARIFKDLLRQRGLELVFEAPYRRAEPDALISIAAQAEKFNPQAIFFPDNVLEASRFFGALTPGFRNAVVPLGPASWDNPEQILRSKSVLQGAVFVSPFFAASTKDVVVRFKEAYESRYRLKPDFLAAQGFDSATMVIAALKRSAAEGISFEQALKLVEQYDGLTGSIRVREDGEMVRTFAVVRLENGVLVEVHNQVPQTYVGRGSQEIVRSTGTLPVIESQPPVVPAREPAPVRPGNF